MLSAKPPRPLCRRSELVHDWKARLGCDAGEGVGRSQSVIVVRDDLGVLEIFANQFESKAETADKICGLAYVWGGRDLRAVAPRSDSANFPGFFSILCSVFRDSVVTIFRVIS